MLPCHSVGASTCCGGDANSRPTYVRKTVAASACLGSIRRPTQVPLSPRNPIGVHSKLWVGDWSRQEASQAIAGTRRAGFDLIELDLTQPDRVDSAMTKELLLEHDLQASGSVGMPAHADISSSDESIRTAGKQLLSKALKAVRDVDGTYFGGLSYSAMGRYSQPCSAEQWRHCRDSLKGLAREAADYGITYGLEVVNRYLTNILNTAQQAMDMIADINEDNVVVHLDTLHMNIEENSLDRACRLCGNKLGYVHAGESHWGGLGTGTVNWDSMFKGLVDIGYTGPITFESFSAAVVSETHSQSLCIWRDLWTEPEDVATRARQFIVANMSAALAAQV